GHMAHLPSDLALALYRSYDPGLGRWLSDDPAGFVDGPNLYAYTTNKPLSLIDKLGLDVRNNSNGTIYVKDENSGRIYPVRPGDVYKGEQDGISVTDLHRNEVFKTTDHIERYCESRWFDNNVRW